MKEPTISLIIPAYNEENYIGECLDYACKHADKLLEIIVVNNASTDNTHEVVLKYPGVKVVHEEKKGLTRARERGYREARGDILAYIDADTRMPEGWVQTVLDEFNRDVHLACLSGPYKYYNVSKRNQLLIKIWNLLTIPLSKITGYVVTGGNFAIRKDILHQMNGFDTSIEFYGEDTNIARRAHHFGKVKFKHSFYMHTSPRRFEHQGLYKTGYVYLINAFSEIFRHKPATIIYKDYR